MKKLLIIFCTKLVLNTCINKLGRFRYWAPSIKTYICQLLRSYGQFVLAFLRINILYLFSLPPSYPPLFCIRPFLSFLSFWAMLNERQERQMWRKTKRIIWGDGIPGRMRFLPRVADTCWTKFGSESPNRKIFTG